jgi:hypothetical protein
MWHEWGNKEYIDFSQEHIRKTSLERNWHKWETILRRTFQKVICSGAEWARLA